MNIHSRLALLEPVDGPDYRDATEECPSCLKRYDADRHKEMTCRECGKVGATGCCFHGSIRNTNKLTICTDCDNL